jgi:hypothetical protein
MAQPPESATDFGAATWELPPLILHPFSDSASSAKLMENTRLSLMACGILPGDGSAPADLVRKLLEGRFAEMRMLFFLGKDLLRWMEQCMEFVARVAELSREPIHEQSFALLLTQNPPESVSQKLTGWGVSDPSLIFSRGIALNHLFGEAPALDQLAEDFIRNYHRYADHVFACWRQLVPFREITAKNFRFDLYASGEYTKMLENEWSSE